MRDAKMSDYSTSASFGMRSIPFGGDCRAFRLVRTEGFYLPCRTLRKSTVRSWLMRSWLRAFVSLNDTALAEQAGPFDTKALFSLFGPTAQGGVGPVQAVSVPAVLLRPARRLTSNTKTFSYS